MSFGTREWGGMVSGYPGLERDAEDSICYVMTAVFASEAAPGNACLCPLLGTLLLSMELGWMDRFGVAYVILFHIQRL
jgi:hypothetical protein